MFGTIWLDLAAVLGALHLLGPAALRYTMRFSARCNPTKVSLDSLPEEVAALFRPRIPEMESLGFEWLGSYDVGSLTNETHSYIAYFCKRSTSDFASVCALTTPKKTASYLEFSTSFTNGMNLETNTNSMLPLTPPDPQHRVFRFPKVQTAEALYRYHHQLLEKYAGGLWAQSESRGEELQRYVRIIENYGPRHVRIGYMQWSEDNESYKLTWKGACLMTGRGLWPMSMFRRLFQRHAMQMELDALEVRGITALQKA
jgi:hypothetical protein